MAKRECRVCDGKGWVRVQWNDSHINVECDKCEKGLVEVEGYALNRFSKDAREISRANGFDNPESIEQVEMTATKLMLIVDECCEALHEVRKTGDVDAFGEELADILIRTVDLGHDLGIDFDGIVERKMAKNRGRGYKHGAKF